MKWFAQVCVKGKRKHVALLNDITAFKGSGLGVELYSGVIPVGSPAYWAAVKRYTKYFWKNDIIPSIIEK